MAGPYYVDLGTLGAWNGRDGTNSSSPWLGLSGLQKAFDSVTIGNGPVYIKGTATMASSGDVGKFMTITFDANSGITLTDGEQVTWDAGEGAWVDGTDKGVVHCGDTTVVTTLELEITSGTQPADNDVIKGTTSGQTVTRAATANALKGIDVDTNAGTNAGGFIKFIGTNASWTVDGTYAAINANSVDTSIIVATSAADLVWYENIRAYGTGGTSKHGIYLNGPEACVVINCCGDNCSGIGLYTSTPYGMVVRCKAHTNTSYGFSLYGSTNVFFCSSYNNSDSGFLIGSTDVLIGCVSHGNSNYGATTGASNALGTVFNCVFDANTTGGITTGASAVLRLSRVIGNRITNHSGASDKGINATEIFVTGWNYFENNADNNIQGTLNFSIPAQGGSATSNINETTDDVTDTDYGYVDSANHDFSTNYIDATDPNLRRTAITIPW